MAENGKRVGIIHYAAPPIVGGVESTIFHQARYLYNQGYPVIVIAGRGELFYPGVDFQPIPEIDSRHPRVLAIGQALEIGEVPEDFVLLRDELVQQLRPGLSSCHTCLVHNIITLHKNLALTAALRVLSDEKVTRFIAWSHDFAWEDPLYTPALHPGYPWDLLREPWPGVRYVAVSEHRQKMLANLLGIPGEAVSVISPGVDPIQFLNLDRNTQQLLEKLSLLQADPLILLPARLTRRKNIEFAVRVTAALHRYKPQVSLVVTGPPGPHNPKNLAYLEALRGLRSEHQLEQRVHFLYEHGPDGHPWNVPDVVIADLYRLADLLLFPSLREGFGIPILEAGLVRLPVFAADIPPVRESGGEMVHRFDPQGDPQIVANSIRDFLAADPAYKLRHRVLQRFTWQAAVEENLIPLIEGR